MILNDRCCVCCRRRRGGGFLWKFITFLRLSYFNFLFFARVFVFCFGAYVHIIYIRININCISIFTYTIAFNWFANEINMLIISYFVTRACAISLPGGKNCVYIVYTMCVITMEFLFTFDSNFDIVLSFGLFSFSACCRCYAIWYAICCCVFLYLCDLYTCFKYTLSFSLSFFLSLTYIILTLV